MAAGDAGRQRELRQGKAAPVRGPGRFPVSPVAPVRAGQVYLGMNLDTAELFVVKQV